MVYLYSPFHSFFPPLRVIFCFSATTQWKGHPKKCKTKKWWGVQSRKDERVGRTVGQWALAKMRTLLSWSREILIIFCCLTLPLDPVKQSLLVLLDRVLFPWTPTITSCSLCHKENTFLEKRGLDSSQGQHLTRGGGRSGEWGWRMKMRGGMKAIHSKAILFFWVPISLLV